MAIAIFSALARRSKNLRRTARGSPASLETAEAKPAVL
jgi:hypothetical protein